MVAKALQIAGFTHRRQSSCSRRACTSSRPAATADRRLPTTWPSLLLLVWCLQKLLLIPQNLGSILNSLPLRLQPLTLLIPSTSAVLRLLVPLILWHLRILDILKHLNLFAPILLPVMSQEEVGCPQSFLLHCGTLVWSHFEILCH